MALSHRSKGEIKTLLNKKENASVKPQGLAEDFIKVLEIKVSRK